MPLALAATDTLAGKVDAGSDVNYFIDGDELTGTTDAYKVAATGQLSTTAGTLYTPGTSKSAIVGTVRLVNTSAATNRICTLYRNGTATGNIWAVLSLAAGESAEWVDAQGWRIYDSNGNVKEAQSLVNGYAIKSVSEIAQGTTTYTPPTGVRALLVHCVGAGGGGGGVTTVASNAAAGGGGAGGGYSRKLILAPKSSYTVAVGAGGTAGANTGGTGGTGGDTTFDSPAVCTAKGGLGGVGMTAGTTSLAVAGGAAGGTGGAVGDTLIAGIPGAPGVRQASGTVGAASGGGGNAAGPIGGGGGVDLVAQGAGNAGGQWGGGGGGALSYSAAAVGGVGANGRIVIEELF